MDTIPDYVEALRRRLGDGSDWGAILATVLAMGSELSSMDPVEKVEENRFHSCQSRVWLIMRHDEITGTVRIAADSDARIMRGLLAIATGFYSGRTPAEIAAHPPAILREAGLLKAVAPGRSDGFYRLLMHIHAFGVGLAGSDEEALA